MNFGQNKTKKQNTKEDRVLSGCRRTVTNAGVVSERECAVSVYPMQQKTVPHELLCSAGTGGRSALIYNEIMRKRSCRRWDRFQSFGFM